MKGTFSDLDLESASDLDLGSASDLDLGEEDETKERKMRCPINRSIARVRNCPDFTILNTLLSFCLFVASNKKDHTFGDKSQEHSLFLK